MQDQTIQCSIVPIKMAPMPKEAQFKNVEMIFDVSVNKNELVLYFNQEIFGKSVEELSLLGEIGTSLINKMINMGFLFNSIFVKINHIISVAVVKDKQSINFKNVAVNIPQTFFSEKETDDLMNFFYNNLVKE